MGEAFTLKYTKQEKDDAKSSKHSKAFIRVQLVISSHVALKQYEELNPWFSELMTRVVRNKLLGSSGIVNSRLLTLSNREGRTIGNSLASIMMGSTSSDIAVEDWILTSKALQELDMRAIWFRPMMNRIAMRLLASVAWGAKFRLFTGAVLSIMDMITDIAAIYRFFKLGQTGFAWANIAFIAACLSIQLGIVYSQNKKRGWKVLAYEAMFVLLMIKPAIDASRVASGEAQEERTLLDQNTELAYTKCAELFAEAIPSRVLQTYAILSDTDLISKQAVFSIFISAGCIAFSSSTISMDLDTDPAKRKITPSFSGYFPNANRMTVFVFMALMTTAHVLTKVLACSLMLRLSNLWLWMYLLGDTSMFWLYKLVRGDLRYWLNLRGALSWIVTVIARIVVKTIVDFTLMIHFRHQYELGGAYWAFNVFSNQAFCFLSVCLYEKHSDGTSEEVVKLLWKVVTGLLIFSMLNFGLFLKSINQNYLWTFFDTRTGKQFVCDKFQEPTDAGKFEIFFKHPSYYRSIDEELMKWLNDNWSKWEETSPDWFTADAISKIPSDMLPVAVLASMGGKVGRRKSIDAMKKEATENDKSKRKQSVRGADLKIIPEVVGKEESEVLVVLGGGG